MNRRLSRARTTRFATFRRSPTVSSTTRPAPERRSRPSWSRPAWDRSIGDNRLRDHSRPWKGRYVMKTALLALLVFVNLSIAEGLRIRVNERSRGGRAYGSAQLSVGESFQYGGGAYGRPLVYFVYVQQPTPQFFAQPELTLPYGY